ncbi:MAG: hypothetical protein ACLQVJ_29220 [Syntrophobacteraceae bacterium]
MRCRECGAIYNIMDFREELTDELEEVLSFCSVDRI